ncbi:oligosaccharide flippase family protein [Macrococcoides canis]|uniref:lipopolysaccharide biosynthesis protein n=1 Tax=Macrococcoides canis TaxID=1855823 RepID=UPI00207CF129|nr:oligosaccharide flippase family protein [Macrococcus canis]MCO4096705.1 oligosaccharide flippase family protein [Macrococcus canis]UTH10029.1 oligosaccharide flippase family protein [Macrococcus canis]
MNNKFIKNVFTVAGGTFFAQLISLLSSPFLTRIFGAEEYGTLGIFLSLTMILAPISAFQLPLAIVLPKDDKEVYSIVKYSTIISIINVLMITVFLIFLGDWFIELLNININKSLLFFLPLFMLFSTFYDLIIQYGIRKEKFYIKSYVDIQQSIIYNIGNLIVGLFYPFATSLIFMSVLNRFLHAYTMLLKLKSESITILISKLINVKTSFKYFIKEYYDFILYRSPQVLLNGLSEAMPTVILGTFFGPTVAGFYLISKKTLEAPVILIGNAIGDVFYPKINKAHNEGENTYHLLLKSNVYLSLIGVVPFSILFFIAPELFQLIFGEEWYTSGLYTRWLSIFLFFTFITRTTIKVMPIYRIQGFHLVFTIISTIIRISSLIYGGYILKDDVKTIIIYSLSSAILYLFLLLYTLKISKTKNGGYYELNQ